MLTTGGNATPPPDEPIISYAQFGEDIVLWRALGADGPGRYVDVGAFHPTADSVTRTFYERGWRGINIDPDAAAVDLFEVQRPDDINLAVAAGSHEGETTFYESSVPGWSTTDASAGAQLDAGGNLLARTVVSVRRLSSILDEHGIGEVDFLKIDAEGSEVEVLSGLDLSRHRPRVVVLEGVAPGLAEGYADEAVARLVDNGYLHVRWDGLNHYLTCEPELVPALSLPAGPVDRYVRFREVDLDRTVQSLRNQLAWTDERLREAQHTIEAAQQAVAEHRLTVEQLAHDLAATREHLTLVLTSRSWRAMAPMRGLVTVVRGPASRVRSVGGRVWRMSRPRLVAVADRFPVLARRLRDLRARAATAATARQHDVDLARERRAAAVRALHVRARLRGRL